ncbi:unnamed protein product [Cuscuta epithymum]|uniref:OCEL domain-containing protein n=1 Tax=Cuscuta epithymum TaxID=186058 RepID=A0AAV0D193_9ASTE|nr:unnamed protein product [Cuscuta epithymum]
MYRGSGKHGRGGGRGRGKRNIPSSFHAPPILSSSVVPGGRLSVGSGATPSCRGTSSAPNSSAASNETEENFSLVAGNALNFSMIIRLVPGLVEEIKRVEAEGGVAQIKFDANATNSNGNVIKVGSKDFRFTWSRDGGDLCDIYEECHSGDHGNGLLVESGSAWRKVNVQRVLDESTKNHVKMLSAEAERKSKSRKAIVLDHGNPSTKSQVKAMAAVEGNTWRAGFKQPPLKKRKAEPPPVHSSSMLTQPENKTASTVKEIHPSYAMQNTLGSKRSTDTKPSDLRSLLIFALMENQSNGLSLKALEKSVGNAFPNSARQIEPILKKIATFQAPGRYFLKPEVKMENIQTAVAEIGSSPEERLHTPPALNKHGELSASQADFSMMNEANELEQKALLDSKTEEPCNPTEEVDILEQSPDFSGEKKASDNSLGVAESSSDSGSDNDSESDSSDSGSQSRSPRGSRSVSRSSSDSESDASSVNSKEASDVEVDIMSDNDQDEKHQVQALEHGLAKSPIPTGGTQGIEPGQFGIDEKDEYVHVIDNIDINKHLQDGCHGFGESNITDNVPVKEGKEAEETGLSSDQHKNMGGNQVQTATFYSEKEGMLKKGTKPEQSGSIFRAPKTKSERLSDVKPFDDKHDRTKRLKTGNINQHQSSASNPVFNEGVSQHSSPDRALELSSKSVGVLVANRMGRESTDFSSQKGHSQSFSGNSFSDSQHPDSRHVELSGLDKVSAEAAEKSVKYGNTLSRSAKYSSESRVLVNEGFSSQREKLNKGSVHKEGSFDEQRTMKVSKDSTEDWHKKSIESQYRKHDNSDPGCSPKENNTSNVGRSLTSGQNKRLQREVSDLELGEFRDFTLEDTHAMQKHTERRSSVKGENKPTTSDHWNSDTGKGKGANKIISGSKKTSPRHSYVAGGTPDGIPKRKSLEPYPQQKSQQHLSQQNHLRVDQNGVGHLNKALDVSSKSRKNEVGGTPETYGDNNHNKVSTSAAKRHEAKSGAVSISTSESNIQKSNFVADLNGRRKGGSLTGNNDDQKRKESPSDEISCSYSKYEKKEPELKGQIKDSSQYKEYVQEYLEKYESYCSLNKILESDRIKFSKFGIELEASKGRDMERYNDILKQLKDSYHQCGARHKRLKKIFVVLHEELKHLKQMMREFAASYAKS